MSDPEYLRQWRRNNPGKCKTYRSKAKASGQWRIWYERNKLQKIKKATEWRRNNPEKYLAYKQKYRSENREYINERAKKYNKNALALQAKYRAADPEKFRAKTRAWRKKYPERARISDANKKAIRKRAEGRFTVSDIDELLLLQRGKCAYCRIAIKKKYHIDHIVPVSRGGTNWPRNLQLLCGDCNMHKHNSDPIDFARKQGRLL